MPLFYSGFVQDLQRETESADWHHTQEAGDTSREWHRPEETDEIDQEWFQYTQLCAIANGDFEEPATSNYANLREHDLNPESTSDKEAVDYQASYSGEKHFCNKLLYGSHSF